MAGARHCHVENAEAFADLARSMRGNDISQLWKQQLVELI